MFTMTIKEQLNMGDRTLVLGIPTYDSIPKKILVKGSQLSVVGVSCGGKPPFLSLEIEKINYNVVGETIVDI